MDNEKIAAFIRKQKVAFICSVDEEGFPNVKAMLKPRKMEGLHSFYFSTNTSSMRVKQYINNPNDKVCGCYAERQNASADRSGDKGHDLA